ncbi:MAG: hypothetical protein ACLQBJ_03585 [Bryobacteraceae bacterium]
MSLADYKHQQKHFSEECTKEDANTEVSCFITVSPDLNVDHRKPSLAVGGADVKGYQLTFYGRKLIGIEYNLVSLSLDSLQRALQDRFGLPALRKYGSEKATIYQWRWKNAVSSMSFETDTRYLGEANLKMQLDKESDERLEQYRKRQDAQARQGL